MLKCYTHFVECLRSINIEPIAYANSGQNYAKVHSCIQQKTGIIQAEFTLYSGRWLISISLF